MPENKFTFELSLSVLNHLGRNLYRSFTTVLGEAISNAWDADAKEVRIYINERNNAFFIKDDGIGMTEEDFQNKFLKIGYSKRESGVTQSVGGRPIIGRKGIGKLALLSCADRITVISKINGGEYIGGKIDNSDLDEAIREDLKPSEYPLGDWEKRDFFRYMTNHNHGTIIKFENIKGGIKNRLPFLKKVMALYFRFSLNDESFSIYINDEKVTLGALSELAKKTQFLWNINNFQDPYINQHLKNLKQKEAIEIEMGKGVEGFIASVEKPRDLSIEGVNERVSIDLFVNGRIREKDVLKNFPIVQVAKNYLYGQIHFNDLDDDKDRFTSSREGIIAGDPKYNQFLTDLRKEIIQQIVGKWDKLRRGAGDDGDPENDEISEDRRKAEELVNKVSKKHFSSKYSEKVVTALQEEAQYNLISYTQCFISENLLRKYIMDNNLVPMSCMKMHDGKDCKNHQKSKNDWCAYCRGVHRRKNYASEKAKAKLSFAIRANGRDILGYLDYEELAEIIKSSAGRKALEYKVIRAEGKGYRLCRNVVMHTSLLTEEAKTRLTSILDNIAAAIDDFVAKIKPKSK